MAAASSPEAQKELLLAAGIHVLATQPVKRLYVSDDSAEESDTESDPDHEQCQWQPGVPLGEFQGVSVDGTGLVVGLDFSEQEALEFDLVVLAPLTSLQVVNFRNCRKATGECWWTRRRERSKLG